MSQPDMRSTMAAVRRSAQERALRSETNALWREVNVLARREQIESRRDVLRLANAWLTFDSTRQQVKAIAWKAGYDPRVGQLVREMQLLDDDLSERLKKHAKAVGSYECVIQPTRWAKRVVAQHREAQAEAERRTSGRQQRTASRTSRPPVKRSAPATKQAPIAKRAGRERVHASYSVEDVQDALNGVMAGSNPLARRR